MFDLSGRTALITGASGDIGSAIARTLHGQGAAVVLTGRREEALQAVAAGLDGRVATVVGDLSSAEAAQAVAAAADQAAASFGGSLDILVNNAGFARDGLSVRMSDDDWSAVIEVNLTAGFRLARAVLRGMMKRRYGRIIGISSIVGVIGNPGQANYAASKAGMIGMTKAIAAEVATRGITVNCVAPGMITTTMTEALNEDQHKRMADPIPMGRLGAVDEVAAAVAFLASSEASYITGHTLNVNGGLVML
ncbi:MAG: 3-oxoacyl-[acyl-carrier-protein] reductase [Alphaproteobacteria bacterium]